MNSQLQLQAYEAPAAVRVHAAEDGHGQTEATPQAPLRKIQGQGTADDLPRRQGSGLAPSMGTTGNAYAKCPECHKWFTSLKAMFGHLRKHPDRGYKGATRPTPATISAAAAVAGDNEPTKKVPRKESVFLALNMADEEKKPWEEAGTKWPAKAKRRRTPVAPMQATSCSEEEQEEAATGMEEEEEEEEEKEAAMILLEMSRTSSETQQQQPAQEPVHAPDAVSGHQIQTSDVEELMLQHQPAGQQIPEAAQIVQLENALELISAESQTPAAKQVTELVITTETVLTIMVPANKAIFPSLGSGAGDKKAKKRRVNSEQTVASMSPPPPPEGTVRTPPARRIPSPASGKKHTCPTCSKSFSTHQALGGHMASHVKNKTTSARHDDLAAALAMDKRNILAHRDQSASNGDVIIPASAGAGKGALQERQDAQPPPARAPTPQTSALQHKCDECSQTFSSGQALGGHKRKHWFLEKQQARAALPAPVLEPESRDFDLNELPKEGQDEDNNQP
jgi:hypothetical protein